MSKNETPRATDNTSVSFNAKYFKMTSRREITKLDSFFSTERERIEKEIIYYLKKKKKPTLQTLR